MNIHYPGTTSILFIICFQKYKNIYIYYLCNYYHFIIKIYFYLSCYYYG